MLWIALVLTIAYAATFYPVPDSQILALQAFYNSTNGDYWLWNIQYGRWNFSRAITNPCVEPWFGITCQCDADSSTCVITGLSINEFNATGTLPQELNLLVNLTSFSIYKNSVGGRLDMIGGLYTLGNTDVSSNMLTGPVPELPPFTVIADLRSNFFTGTIPTYLSIPTYCFQFYLSGNLLTGTIPPSLYAIVGLFDLDISYNQLTGTISSQFLNLVNLQYVSFDFNQLSGKLDNMFNLVAANLIMVSVNNNMFTGRISTVINHWHALEYLYLSYNYLTGNVEGLVFNRLNLFLINNNFITGRLPGFLTSFRLQIVDVGINLMTGPLVGFGSGGSSSMGYLILSSNKFTGTVPTTLAGVQGLVDFQINDNLLTGELPEIFNSTMVLSVVRLNRNFFHGTLDKLFPSYHNFTDILTVDVSNNILSGTLPFNLFQSTFLSTFVAGINCFSGTISSEVCQARRLNIFDISGLGTSYQCRIWTSAFSHKIYLSNSVPNVLPSCLFEIKTMFALYAPGNGLSMHLPEIPVNGLFRNISLSHNYLTGTIPTSIQTHKRLRLLDISYNQLSGTIEMMDYVLLNYNRTIIDMFNCFLSTQGCVVKNSTILYLNNNRLSGRIPAYFEDGNNTINILEGNMFECRTNPSNLPKNDPSASSYVCGSVGVDRNYYGFLAVVGFTILLMLFIRYMTSYVSALIGCGRILYACIIMDYSGQYAKAGRTLKNLEDCFYKIRVLVSCISAYIVLICMPIFAGVHTHKYSTYTYLYGWILSAGYFKGLGPQFVIGMLWLIMFGLVYVVSYYIKIDIFGILRLIDIRKAEVPLRRKVQEYSRLFFNFAVMTFVNGTYVYVTINSSRNDMFKIGAFALLVVFKLIWNSLIVVPMLNELNDNSLKDLVALLFNNVLAPLLATFAVDSSCFYNLFVPPDPIYSSYIFPQCDATNLDNSCDRKSYVFVSNIFYPPFLYSYQCGSGLLRDYTPVFVAMFTITGFVLPLGQLLVFLYFFTTKYVNENSASCEQSDQQVSIGDRKTRQLQVINRNRRMYDIISCGCISYRTLPLDIVGDFDIPLSNQSKKYDGSSVIDDAESADDSSMSGTGSSTVIVPDSELSWRELSRYKIRIVCLNCAVSFLILLTFGFTYPPLAVIVWCNVCVNTLFLQMYIRRHFIQISEDFLSLSVLKLYSNRLYKESRRARKIIFGFIPEFACISSVYMFPLLFDTYQNLGVPLFLICFSIMITAILNIKSLKAAFPRLFKHLVADTVQSLRISEGADGVRQTGAWRSLMEISGRFSTVFRPTEATIKPSIVELRPTTVGATPVVANPILE